MPRYSFGSFLLDTEARTLVRDGAAIPMAGKTFDTLAVLVQNRGRLVDKDELLSRVWPGIVVEEANLSQAVFTVRKILGDNPKDPRYIATVPGRGYQFVAQVNEFNGEVPNNRHRKAAIGTFAVLAPLVALTWFLLPRPPKPAPELIQKRLTFNSYENPVQSAAISPDGKYLANSDPTGIHVKLLSTNEERLIPKPAGVPAGAYWSVASWFPDGTQLLANASETGGHKSIWTVSVLGQSPRQLREGAVGFEVSPDGAYIAFGPSGTLDYIREIWVMGIQGGNAKKILEVDGVHEWVQCVHWSPDGRRLAYIRVHRISDTLRRSIETSDLQGANRTMVVPGTDLFLGDFRWLPEGRIVYARGDAGNSVEPADGNLWQIGINRSGSPAGKPKRITQWAGSYASGLSASSDGKRLVVLKLTDQGQAYVSELSEGGTRITPPRRLTNDDSNDFPTAWTADSKAVLFLSDRNGKLGVYKQGINQENAEPLYTGPQGANLATRLSADGAWVLFMEDPAEPANPDAESRLMRMPAGGGAPQFVLEMRNPDNVACARAPASLCVLLEPSQDRKQLLITAFDPIKGRGRVLRTMDVDPSDTDNNSTLSPDGSTFAIAFPNEAQIRIRLLSLSGGADHEIRLRDWPNNTNLDWSSDGKGFFCGSQSARAVTLLYVDLKGNARVLWQFKGGAQIAGIPSPDGRYLAILPTVTNSNVWMLEGF